MYTIKRTALSALQITGEDELSKYRRSIHAYTLSIFILFPPPRGGVLGITPSAIASAARTIAATRLFDHRLLGSDLAWRTSERDVGGIKIPRKALQPKLAFQDTIARSLFRDYLFHPRRGLSNLLEITDFTTIEEQFSKRTEKMISIADVINIYILCADEIKKRSHHNGFDVVTKLYLSSTNSETGDRTLANDWKDLKSAAVFQYVLRYQIKDFCFISPPRVNSNQFVEQLLSMANLEAISKLIQAHDYISSKLNHDFNLDLPVIDKPTLNFDLHLDQEYRRKLLKLLF
jgi:hypothetical protein